MSTNFDLEQQILDCWGIVDELGLVYEELCDENITIDRTTNVLLGMKELYQIKFDRLFRTFEKLCDEIRVQKENECPPVPRRGSDQFQSTQGLGPNGPAGGRRPSTFDVIRKLQEEQDQKIKDLLNQERIKEIEEGIDKIMFKNKL
jgi:hypothetical protein